MMKRNKKGQSTLEYAILIIIIIAALLSLQTYIKRGISGRLQSSTDDIGSQFSGGANYFRETITRSNTYSNNLAGVVRSGKQEGGEMTTAVTTNVTMSASQEWKP